VIRRLLAKARAAWAFVFGDARCELGGLWDEMSQEEGTDRDDPEPGPARAVGG
jgi:hypothetical protein